MSEKRKIDDLFRDQLRDFEESPANSMWERIIWDIPVNKPFYMQAGMYIVLIGFALLITSGYFMNKNFVSQNSSSPTVSFPESIPGFNKNNSEQQQMQLQVPINQKTFDLPASEEVTQRIEKLNYKPAISEDLNSTPPVLDIDTKTEYLSYLPAEIGFGNKLSDKNIDLLRESELGESNIRNMFVDIKGFYFGIVGRMNNTWIYNQNTYLAFREYEMAYQPVAGEAYGFSLGYNFSSKYGVQLDWIVQSNQGQKYADKILNKWQVREVDLNYMKFPLLAKYKFSRNSSLTKMPVVQNLLLGIQYGYLKAATVTINDHKEEITERFRRHEFSLVLGLEYELYLTKNLFLNSGIRGSVGTDINAKDWPVVLGKYKRSHNILIGAHLGLNYNIRK